MSYDVITRQDREILRRLLNTGRAAEIPELLKPLSPRELVKLSFFVSYMADALQSELELSEGSSYDWRPTYFRTNPILKFWNSKRFLSAAELVKKTHQTERRVSNFLRKNLSLNTRKDYLRSVDFSKEPVLLFADDSGNFFPLNLGVSFDRNIDLLFGRNVFENERWERQSRGQLETRFKGKEVYLGERAELLLTPYFDFNKIIRTYAEPLARSGREPVVVDLGAGFFRMGLLKALRYPKVHVIGYELLPSRVKTVQSVLRDWNDKKATIIRQDLASPAFDLPPADIYFFYEATSKEDTSVLLKKLKAAAKKKGFRLVVTGGDGMVGILSEQDWLRPEVDRWKATRYGDEEHEDNMIYVFQTRHR